MGHSSTRIAALLIAGATLASCGLPSVNSPTFFSFDVSDQGLIQGSYNPQGYNSADIKQRLATICDGTGLAHYQENPPHPNGTVAFVAHCK